MSAKLLINQWEEISDKGSYFYFDDHVELLSDERWGFTSKIETLESGSLNSRIYGTPTSLFESTKALLGAETDN